MNFIPRIHYFKQFLFAVLIMSCVLIFTSCGGDRTKDVDNGNDNGSDIGIIQEGTCGDDVCETIEKKNCPEDCLISGITPVEPGVVYITMMVHLEGWENEATNRDSFERHTTVVRELATLFNEHDAKATFEAKPEFVEGCAKWGDNVLLELYNEGHGIGVHADAGGNADWQNLSQEEFTQQIAKMKTDMESVLGHEVRHVSGICSSLDWVKAAVDAGYEFTSGMVGYCAMSLPQESRPNEYKFCSSPSKCHGEIPVELEDRVHPWKASSGQNWLEADPNGELVLLAPENVLSSLGDGEDSEWDESDIEEYIRRLKEVITYSEQGKITTFYVGLSIGNANLDEEMFEKWFEAIQPYVDAGQVKWKTLPEMYDAYVGSQK